MLQYWLISYANDEDDTKCCLSFRLLLVPILVIMRPYFVFVRQKERGYQITAKAREGIERDTEDEREAEKKEKLVLPKTQSHAYMSSRHILQSISANRFCCQLLLSAVLRLKDN
jgi:hypothetical protein